MERINEQAIAEALLNAPGWARVGLTAPTPWIRRNAAIELARAVIGDSEPGRAEVDERHSRLTL